MLEIVLILLFICFVFAQIFGIPYASDAMDFVGVCILLYYLLAWNKYVKKFVPKDLKPHHFFLGLSLAISFFAIWQRILIRPFSFWIILIPCLILPIISRKIILSYAPATDEKKMYIIKSLVRTIPFWLLAVLLTVLPIGKIISIMYKNAPEYARLKTRCIEYSEFGEQKVFCDELKKYLIENPKKDK